MLVSGDAPPRRVTEQLDSGDSAPVVSERTHRMVFRRDTREIDIYRVELDTTGEAHNSMPLISSTRLDRSAVYSPDGKKIAFSSLRIGTWQLFVSDADGQNPVPLTSFEGRDTSARWSDDGSKIGFFQSSSDGSLEWNTIAATGGPRSKVAVPTASGLGQALAGLGFGEMPRHYQARPGAVWTAPSDGSEPREVFKFPGDISTLWEGGRGLYFSTGGGPSTPGEMMFYPEVPSENPFSLSVTG